jgi:hypothetical protein
VKTDLVEISRGHLDTLGSPTAEFASEADFMEGVATKMDSLAAQYSGETALLLEAGAQFVREGAAVTRKFEQATLRATEIISEPEIFQTLDELHAAEDLVNSELSAAEILCDWTRNYFSRIREVMESYEITPRTIEDAISGARKTADLELKKKIICELAPTISQETLAQLAQLNGAWGRWSYSEAEHTVVFENEKELAEFDETAGRILELVASRESLQREVLERRVQHFSK